MPTEATAQPTFTDCRNCGTADHSRGYFCPCVCHVPLAECACGLRACSLWTTDGVSFYCDDCVIEAGR
jgi:hypothetical protein